MAFNLDISGHASNQMITAIVYKKISDLLISKGRRELFHFIKSIKISGGRMSIKTQKPIVNSELSNYYKEISDIFNGVLQTFGIMAKEIKVSFR